MYNSQKSFLGTAARIAYGDGVDLESERASALSDKADKYFLQKLYEMMKDPASLREAIGEMSDVQIIKLMDREEIYLHCKKYLEPIAREAALKKAEDN